MRTSDFEILRADALKSIAASPGVTAILHEKYLLQVYLLSEYRFEVIPLVLSQTYLL